MKIKKTILLTVTAILMIAAFTFMVNAGWEVTNVTLSKPADNIYTSQDSSTLNFSFSWANTTLGYVKANCTLYNATAGGAWNTTGDISNYTENGATTRLIPTITFTTDTSYSWQVNCTNSTVRSYSNISAAAYTFTYDASAPTITLNTFSSNQAINSRITELNITVADVSGGSGRDNNSVYILQLFNTSGMNITVNGTRMYNISAGGFNDFIASTNFNFTNSSYPDGNYILSFRANDTIGSTYGADNQLIQNITFKVDKTDPVVNNNTRNTTWHTGTTSSINITATDAGGGVRATRVYYTIYNMTGNWTPWTALSNASSQNLDWYNATFDTTALRDGKYNISYKVNDTITLGTDNQVITPNGSLNNTFRVDNTNPVITHECVPTATFKSGAIACTCSATDATSGANEGSKVFTESPSTSTVGAFTTTCTYADNAGNSLTDTITYTVRGTGGSGGGSWTGAPAATTAATVTQTIAAITAGTAEAIAIDSADISITEIAITPTVDVSNVKVTVQSLSEKPAATAIPAGEVYQYLDITATNIENKLKTGEITFEIPNSWITSRNIDKNGVLLHRHADGEWNALTTTLVSEGTSTTTYKATTTGFSYFVVTGEQKAAPWEEAAAEKGKEALAALNIPNWMYYLIIVVIIGIVGYYFYTKKKK